MTESNQLQAVILSVIMVLTMIGGGMGMATASEQGDIDSAELSTSVVQSQDSIYITGTHSYPDGDFGNDEFRLAVTDLDTNKLHRVEFTPDDDDFEADGTFEFGPFEVDNDLDLENNDRTRIAVIRDDSGDGASGPIAGDLEVDDDKPYVEIIEPEADDVVNTIDQPITATIEEHPDGATANEDLLILFDIMVGDKSNSYQINPDADTGGGAEYDAESGELVIYPGTGDIPELEDGKPVEIDIEVTDRAGNVGSDTLEFASDLEELQIVFDGEDTGSVFDQFVTFSHDANLAPITSDPEIGPFEIAIKPGDPPSDVDLNHAASSLEITGPNGYHVVLDESNTEYESDGDEATFTITAGENSVDPFDRDGEYEMYIEGENEAGTPVNKTIQFSVDTEEPTIETFEPYDGFEDVLNVERAHDQPIVRIEVNKNVSSEIELHVAIADDEFDKKVSNNDGMTVWYDAPSDQHYPQFADDPSVVYIEFDEDFFPTGVEDGLKDENAQIEVVEISDLAGNTIEEPDDAAFSFAIDTAVPAIEVPETPDTNPDEIGNVVSGAVNFTEFIDEPPEPSSDNEIAERNVYIAALGDGNNIEGMTNITADIHSVPTHQLFPNYYGYKLYIETVDETGNFNSEVVGPFTIDNDQSINVHPDAPPGALEVNPDNRDEPARVVVDHSDEIRILALTGNLHSLFTVDSESDVDRLEFGDEIYEDITNWENIPPLDPSAHRGEIITVSAINEDTDEEWNVNLEVERFEGAEVTEDRELSIVVTTDEQPHTLDVDITQADDHWDTIDITKERDDFDEEFVTADEIGIFADQYRYTTTVELPRDGQFEVSISDVDRVGDIDLIGDTFSSIGDATTLTVDTAAPEIVDASLADRYETEIDGDSPGEFVPQVEVRFDQPIENVDPDGHDFNIDELDVGFVHAEEANGSVILELDEEIQTADGPVINVTGSEISSAYGDNMIAETEAGYTHALIATHIFELEADSMTVVSIPAVTGTVNPDAVFDVPGIDRVWAYDAAAEEFIGYSPDDPDPELTSLEGGQGYIVTTESDEGATVEVYAENIPGGLDGSSPQVLTSQEITSGWNLVGHYQSADQPRTEALDTIDNSVDVIQLGYSGGMTEDLETGEGYWVFADESDQYAPQTFGEVGPDIFNLDMDQAEFTGDEEVTIEVQINQDNNPIENVLVHAPDIGIHQEPLTEVADDRQGYTFNGDFDVDIQGTGEFEVIVQATDTAGLFDIHSTIDEPYQPFSGAMADFEDNSAGVASDITAFDDSTTFTQQITGVHIDIEEHAGLDSELNVFYDLSSFQNLQLVSLEQSSISSVEVTSENADVVDTTVDDSTGTAQIVFDIDDTAQAVEFDFELDELEQTEIQTVYGVTHQAEAMFADSIGPDVASFEDPASTEHFHVTQSNVDIIELGGETGNLLLNPYVPAETWGGGTIEQIKIELPDDESEEFNIFDTSDIRDQDDTENHVTIGDRSVHVVDYELQDQWNTLMIELAEPTEVSSDDRIELSLTNHAVSLWDEQGTMDVTISVITEHGNEQGDITLSVDYDTTE